MANTSTDVSAECNCLAVRQAARYITQFYDQHLAAAGLRTTQYSRNVQPLERDSLIVIEPDPEDRRSRILRLSRTGERRFERAHKGWAEAQRRFEDAYGEKQASELRRCLRAVIASRLGPFDSAD